MAPGLGREPNPRPNGPIVRRLADHQAAAGQDVRLGLCQVRSRQARFGSGLQVENRPWVVRNGEARKIPPELTCFGALHSTRRLRDPPPRPTRGRSRLPAGAPFDGPQACFLGAGGGASRPGRAHRHCDGRRPFSRGRDPYIYIHIHIHVDIILVTVHLWASPGRCQSV
jgi:hypothetical protein